MGSQSFYLLLVAGACIYIFTNVAVLYQLNLLNLNVGGIIEEPEVSNLVQGEDSIGERPSKLQQLFDKTKAAGRGDKDTQDNLPDDENPDEIVDQDSTESKDTENRAGKGKYGKSTDQRSQDDEDNQQDISTVTVIRNHGTEVKSTDGDTSDSDLLAQTQAYVSLLEEEVKRLEDENSFLKTEATKKPSPPPPPPPPPLPPQGPNPGTTAPPRPPPIPVAPQQPSIPPNGRTRPVGAPPIIGLPDTGYDIFNDPPDAALQADIDGLLKELDEAQNPPNCRNARYMLCDVHTKKLGFGYQLHQIICCLSEAHAEGRIAVLSPPLLSLYGERECEGRWDCFFEPFSRCQNEIQNLMDSGGLDYVRHGGADNRGSDYVGEKWKAKGHSHLWYFGILTTYIFKPNSRVKAILDQQNCHPEFGIHVRRTDKVTSHEGWFHDLEQFIQHLDHAGSPWYYHSAYGQKLSKTVYVATDDPKVQSEEVHKFPQFDYIWNSQSADSATAYGFTGSRYSQQGLDSLIIDLVCLSNAAYFVGTFSSQVSRIVVELQQSKWGHPGIHSHSLDDPWYGACGSMIYDYAKAK